MDSSYGYYPQYYNPAPAYYGWQGDYYNPRYQAPPLPNYPPPNPPPPPPTAPPPPPPAGPEIRQLRKSRKRKHDSRDDGPKSDGEISDDSVVDDEELDYKSKLDLAAAILEVELQTKVPKGETIVKKDTKAQEETLLAFPFSGVVNKHFEAAWMALTGKETFEEEEEDILMPPVGASKFKNRPRSKLISKRKWYKVMDSTNPGWPLGSLKGDSNCQEVMGKNIASDHGKFVEDCMSFVGRSLEILNQYIFFAKAGSELMTTMESDIKEGKAPKNSWTSFKEFVEVQAQSVEDLTALNASLMLNLLVERRDQVVAKTNLSNQLKMALKFLSPLDKGGRLFSGKHDYFFAKETYWWFGCS
jgi:hypothetical protein